MLADLIGGYIAPPPPTPRPRPRPDEREAATVAQVVAPLDALLTTLADSDDFQARLDAVRSLATRDDPRARDALCRALRDHGAEVAIAAIEALATRGGDDVRRALRSVVENDDGYHSALVRAAAVRSLGQLGQPDDDAILHTAMRDVDAEVSVSAIATIAERGGAGDAEALLGLLQDGSRFFLPLTRLSAARALGHISDPPRAGVSRLLEIERDADVRNALQRIIASG